jgi:hypothetical protein
VLTEAEAKLVLAELRLPAPCGSPQRATVIQRGDDFVVVNRVNFEAGDIIQEYDFLSIGMQMTETGDTFFIQPSFIH